MEKDLKAQNAWPLAAMYVGTLLVVAFVHWGVKEVFTFSLQLGEQVLVVAAITVFGGVLFEFPVEPFEASIGVLAFSECVVGSPLPKDLRTGPTTALQ